MDNEVKINMGHTIIERARLIVFGSDLSNKRLLIFALKDFSSEVKKKKSILPIVKKKKARRRGGSLLNSRSEAIVAQYPPEFTTNRFSIHKLVLSSQTRSITYSVWDFVHVDPLQSLFISKRNIFLFVLNLTKVDIDPVHKWISYILTRVADARIIIVGITNDDKTYSISVSQMNVIRSIFTSYPNIREYMIVCPVLCVDTTALSIFPKVFIIDLTSVTMVSSRRQQGHETKIL
eukprot:TRINITY_DN7920_c0_g2_i7.p1 TRINITY_DN7920_c0_g2~~TRINITY_DN7920_c0_g2_i7.p1  ORF type:complete len:234 (+),score=24.13 TRINITY_DN7920_c0_g2_i7:275-976(+)